MKRKVNPEPGNLNPVSGIDFDFNDPAAWYRYVADSFVLTGLSRRSGEAYARDVRILARRYGRPPFELTEGEVRAFILERHGRLNGSSRRRGRNANKTPRGRKENRNGIKPVHIRDGSGAVLPRSEKTPKNKRKQSENET